MVDGVSHRQFALRVDGFLSTYIVGRFRLGKGRGAAMGIDHDKGKRNTAERRRVPRSYLRFQVTAINGRPAPNTFILNISPLGAQMESPPLAIPAKLNKASCIRAFRTPASRKR
jgi:hypothetical protein